MNSFARLFLCLVALAPATQAGAETLPLKVPFNFENNQILLEVGINGAAPRWFIVDSGASGCIVDTGVARAMHLKTEGQAQGTGAGHGAVDITFVNNVTYSFAGGSVAVPRSYVIDFSQQPALLGREIAGVLGYEFFMRYVVALDFDTSVMTLSAPDTYVAPTSATVIPITIERKTPYFVIRAKIADEEPVEQKVQIDSGSGDAVDVDVLSRSPQTLEVVGGVGLGQEFRTVLGRGEWAEIGPFRLMSPTGATGGVQLIGLEVLRRFDVAFDYQHARLVLSPNRFFAEPFVADASGLDLRWTADLRRFVVHDVATKSPAHEAGIRTNDEIVAIDNQPTRNFTIAQVNRMLTHDGQTIVLSIRSGSAERNVTLRLRKRL